MLSEAYRITAEIYCITGNDLLAILDALIENEGDNITTDAVDFSGNPVNF